MALAGIGSSMQFPQFGLGGAGSTGSLGNLGGLGNIGSLDGQDSGLPQDLFDPSGDAEDAAGQQGPPPQILQMLRAMHQEQAMQDGGLKPPGQEGHAPQGAPSQVTQRFSQMFGGQNG